MISDTLAIVVLAAGLGTRMKSRLPKVMHPVAGRPMVSHLLAGLETLKPQRTIVVIGPEMEGLVKTVHPHPTVIQKERLGTGHAVMAARSELADFTGDVLIVYGDTPLLSPATLKRMVENRRRTSNTAVVVLGFRPDDPGAYGRLVLGHDGTLERIVEANDANASERLISLCNSGVMAIDGKLLGGFLDRLTNINAKGEYYLTDVVAIARRDGHTCRVVEGVVDELIGVNSRAELAQIEALVQKELRAKALAGGATLIAPETVYFSHDTKIGRDVVIGPFVVFAPGVTVEDDVEIKGFCHFENAHIAAGAQVGPYARLRPGADVGPGAHVGNFVEIKNARLEDGAKVNHLTYIGDARVGAKANVGAGTITCNYDGFFKDFTDIGAGAFIGSNSSLVAPVKIGDGAITGAGSVIAKDIPADSLAITRGPHTVKDDWARTFRSRRAVEKANKAKAKD